MPPRLALSAVLLLLAFGARAEYSNGIYAELNTSMGSITCRLEHVLAPKACANFMGLAAGQRHWLDLPTGLARTDPFYDGLTFHRVIAGFMIQGGSPNGLGTDGPGYAFIDEFSPSLRHDGFGVLSMANSGPDSNGSQFFITVASQPHLNDVHTVFGKVIGGSNVVYAINHVLTDTNSRPLTSVVIQNVQIRRVGSDALAFNIGNQSLPTVTNADLRITKSGMTVDLAFNSGLYADNRLYSSTNLGSWASANLGIETAAPILTNLQVPATAPKEFFRLAQVQYPGSTLAPENLFGRTLIVNFTSGPGIITNVFNYSGGGTYTWSLGSGGTITGYAWYQEPYRARLWPIYYSPLVPMSLILNFNTASSGTFSGTAYTIPTPSSVYGTFTLTP